MPTLPVSSAYIIKVGLDSSGKTTALYKLKSGETQATIPTIGYNQEIIKYKNNNCEIWDIGGLVTIRPLWRHFLQDKHGLIFVVDSSDAKRVTEAGNELANMLKEDELKDAAVLVYANKQDMPNAMTTEELASALNLTNLTNQKWHIQATCATQGQGLSEGLEWLSNELAKREDSEAQGNNHMHKD